MTPVILATMRGMTVNVVSESVFAKTQGVHTAFLTIVTIARQKGLDVKVNSLRRADITHIHTVWPFGLFKLLTSKPVVVSAHIVPESLLGSLKGDKLWYAFAKWYLPFFYNRADLVFAVAPLVKEQLLKIGVKSRIEIFPNPVNEQLFHTDIALRKAGRTLLNISDGTFVFLCVGQVQPRKGVADFIKLAKKFPQARFVWVGNKPFKSLTADDAEMNSLLANPPPNFSLCGPYTYDQMPQIMNAADAFLFPSFQENAPMALIEAASCGLPLIMRDLPEYKLLYKEGYIACTNESSFEKAIHAMMVGKEFYKEAQKDSLALAKKYSIDILGTILIDYYKSLR